ncbi:MAG: hypothetical protein QXR69_02670 [Conexivisphaerales archaeon]
MKSEEIKSPKRSVKISLISVFAALITVSTIAVIPLPPPLYEITWSPPIYMAFSVLAGPWPAFIATGIGSFLGETFNILTRPGGSPIYPFGMLWARAPEALIVGWARNKSWKMISIAMIIATVYETIAFLIPDWAFYTYGLFGYGQPTSLAEGFWSAFPDIFTLVDLAYVPIAIAIIKASAPAFKRLGLSMNLSAR